MTEAAWRSCYDPVPMLRFLSGRASDRKLRLFACAFGRAAWRYLNDERSLIALQAAEEFADRRSGRSSDMEAARSLAKDAMQEAWERIPDGTLEEAMELVDVPEAAAWVAAGAAFDAAASQGLAAATEAIDRGLFNVIGGDQPALFQCDLLREIFGVPHRPVAFDPAWLTPTGASLARAAYDERHMPSGELDPPRLSILADALEEAGVPDELLSHLRSPGPHVRGCWPLDLGLGLT